MSEPTNKTEETIFTKALEIQDLDQRNTWLKEACGPDEKLRLSVLKLLDAHQAASLLDDPVIDLSAVQNSDEIEDIGKVIGHYKLQEKIGEGGMGVVYLAQQQEPINRPVAIKIIKPGMDSQQVLKRFETEQHALARLDHPNVARVFDAGVTELGRPYFVMEYVPGVPITEHCDDHNLSIEKRLELFIQVCQAVHHAHQKGIIHRDIKPSNILISTQNNQALPKVIDFGVAKAIRQPLTEKTFFTEQGQLIGTPEYMSPEQAQLTSEDIDIRSDIYSLGVLLYELLTGALPFDPKSLRAAALGEIQRIIQEDDPPRCSTRLSSLGDKAQTIAQKRSTEVSTLTRRLHKELEWIPLKALRKDRQERYRSASEFADDVKNYLEGSPLIAGPESAGYRVKKFMRRNRALATSIAAVMIVLLVGIAATTTFALREMQARHNEEAARIEAQQQAKIAGEVNRFLNEDLLAAVNPEHALGQEVTVREVLDAASLNIQGKFEDEPLIEASIRTTLGKTYTSLGEFTIAQEHLERALQLYRNLYGEQNLSTLNAQTNLSIVYQEQGRFDDTEALQTETLRLKKQVLGDKHPDTLRTRHNLALLYFLQGRYDQAESMNVETLALKREVLGAEHPDTLKLMINLANLYTAQRRYQQAEELYIQVLELLPKVFDEGHPDALAASNSLAVLYKNQGRYAEAEKLYVETLAVQKRVVGAEHPDTLVTMFNTATLYRLQGRGAEAEELYVETLEKLNRVLGEEHPHTLSCMNSLAIHYKEQRRYDQAEPMYVRTLAVQERVLGEDHPDTMRTMYNLANLYRTMKRYDEAEPLYVRALEKRRKVLGEENPSTLSVMNNLAVTLFRLRRYPEAAELHEQTLEIRRRVLGEQHASTMSTKLNLANVYSIMHRFDEAEELYVDNLEYRRANYGDGHSNSLLVMNNLTNIYRSTKRYDKLEAWLTELVEIKSRALGEDHAEVLKDLCYLAWMLATCPEASVRDGAQAVVNARRACELVNWQEGRYWDILAAAYAEAGDFAEAVAWQEKVIETLGEDTPEADRKIMEERLVLFREGKPFHVDGSL